MKHVDGTDAWVSWTDRAFFDISDNIIEVQAVGRDITERKRNEEKVAFQASLLDQVHNGVIALDAENKIIYWNKFAEKLRRFPQQQH